MFEDYVIPTRRRTAEDVLAVFVAEQQVFLSRSPKWPFRTVPKMQMTLADWYEAAWIDFSNDFRKGCNRLFRVNLTRQQWRRIATPEKQKTLGDVCGAIAEIGSAMDLIEPVSVFGQSCRTAGAFAFVVTKLRGAGFDSGDVTPSTPLEPLISRARKLFEEMATLEPKLLPRMRRRGDGAGSLMVGMVIVLLLFAWVLYAMSGIVRTLPFAPGVAIVGLIFLLVAGPVSWISERRIRLRFEGLNTVGDLCRLLASA